MIRSLTTALNCGVENDTMPPKVSFCVGPDPQTKMLSIRHFHCFGASNDTGQEIFFGIICIICTPQDAALCWRQKTENRYL